MLLYCFPGLLTAFSHSDIKEPFKDPKFNFYKLQQICGVTPKLMKAKYLLKLLICKA